MSKLKKFLCLLSVSLCFSLPGCIKMSMMVDVLDGEGLPEYSGKIQAARGPETDLDEMIINGVEDEGEWTGVAAVEKLYVINADGTADFKTIVKCKTSEKGLYVFAKAIDYQNIRFSDRYDANNDTMRLCVGKADYSGAIDFKAEAYNLYHTAHYVKYATKCGGQITQKKPDQNVGSFITIELFVTWDELKTKSGINREDGFCVAADYNNYNYYETTQTNVVGTSVLSEYATKYDRDGNAL